MGAAVSPGRALHRPGVEHQLAIFGGARQVGRHRQVCVAEQVGHVGAGVVGQLEGHHRHVAGGELPGIARAAGHRDLRQRKPAHLGALGNVVHRFGLEARARGVAAVAAVVRGLFRVAGADAQPLVDAAVEAAGGGQGDQAARDRGRAVRGAAIGEHRLAEHPVRGDEAGVEEDGVVAGETAAVSFSSILNFISKTLEKQFHPFSILCPNYNCIFL